MNDELVDLVHEYEAIKRWEAGEDPCFSTGICESTTCGYGKLDEYGYWQFPLYPAEEYLELMKQRRSKNATLRCKNHLSGR
jgi:hypothetical protein